MGGGRYGWALQRHADGVVYLAPAALGSRPYLGQPGDCFGEVGQP
jgi:hypothetical protein